MLLVVIVVNACPLTFGNTGVAVETVPYTVGKGVVSNTISGSGAVQPIDRYH